MKHIQFCISTGNEKEKSDISYWKQTVNNSVNNIFYQNIILHASLHVFVLADSA